MAEVFDGTGMIMLSRQDELGLRRFPGAVIISLKIEPFIARRAELMTHHPPAWARRASGPDSVPPASRQSARPAAALPSAR